MIAILDYDTGHDGDVSGALASAGLTGTIVNSIDRLEAAHQILIPSCDSFAKGIRSIRDRGYIRPILRAVDDGRVVLAMGRGAHLLFDVSYEEGQHTGLGLVHGKVARFEFGGHPVAATTPATHQGWTPVNWQEPCPLFAGMQTGASFYFDHAYHAEPLDENVISATSRHGTEFAAVIWQRNLIATEFLPHRSGDAGMAMLRNLARW